MIKLLLIALLLNGNLYYLESNGRCGVRIAAGSNTVSHVYKTGTKCVGILYEGDKIISSDGKSDCQGMLGPANSICHLVIKRAGEVKELDVERVPVNSVKD